MIDFHCHLLPGLDDGPDSIDESLVMARALASFGFIEVHCTPHCIAGQYEISPVEVREAVRKLQARLDLEGIALILRTGMEYYLDECFERFAANLLPLGESRVVLCEAPPQAPPALVVEMVSLIVVQGFVPLIAHPERSEPVWQLLENLGLGAGDSGLEHKIQSLGAEEPGLKAGDLGLASTTAAKPFWKRLFPFASPRPPVPSPRSANPQPPAPGFHELPEQALYQANLGSFIGYYGPQPQRRAYELLQRGLYSCFASDLHDARSAAGLLEQARDKLDFNPALQKLGAFKAPQGEGGSSQMAFW